MEKIAGRLSWLSALGPEFQPRLVRTPSTLNDRVRTEAQSDDEVGAEAPPKLNRRDDAVLRVNRSTLVSDEVTPEECQRAFDAARQCHPDALYHELTEVAAHELGVSARRLRKHVPNPFR